MQVFYFFVIFALILIYILKVYRNKSSSILLRKNMLNSLHFAFEKYVSSQVLKDFSVENYSHIYLSGIINYWGSILTLYIT